MYLSLIKPLVGTFKPHETKLTQHRCLVLPSPKCKVFPSSLLVRSNTERCPSAERSTSTNVYSAQNWEFLQVWIISADPYALLSGTRWPEASSFCAAKWWKIEEFISAFCLIVNMKEWNPVLPTCGALQHWVTNVNTSSLTIRDIVGPCKDIWWNLIPPTPFD